jgi:hypothetical protein
MRSTCSDQSPFSTDDGEDFGGFEPMTFKRCDDADLPDQLVDKSAFQDRPYAAAKFVKHHGRASDDPWGAQEVQRETSGPDNFNIDRRVQYS